MDPRSNILVYSLIAIALFMVGLPIVEGFFPSPGTNVFFLAVRHLLIFLMVFVIFLLAKEKARENETLQKWFKGAESIPDFLWTRISGVVPISHERFVEVFYGLVIFLMVALEFLSELQH